MPVPLVGTLRKLLISVRFQPTLWRAVRNMMQITRLFHTVRYLKPTQIGGRLANFAWRQKADLSPPPDLRSRTGQWMPPILQPRSLFARWRVRFLNEDGEIEKTAQWNDPARDKLWLYNLHYFDDLAGAPDIDHRVLQGDLIDRWIAENPPGTGNGWEPYPLSLRIVNWIKWSLAGADLGPDRIASLAVQSRWLAGCIEWHLLGNHLLANAKALIFAGIFFDGPESRKWLARGLAIFRRELAEQVLADGGHFELSPMYHMIILEDILDTLNVARTYGHRNDEVFAFLPETIASMRSWLATMIHPDQNISFFNDAAFGIAASPTELDGYATRLGLPASTVPEAKVMHLAASGYVRVLQDDATAMLDVAAVGPDYLPGHAHADTFSFEMSIVRERMIVNGGTSVYGIGPLRQAQRATRAHSTVEIDGENSSEVWSGFRVARRARIVSLDVINRADAPEIHAAHDGYTRLRGKPIHRRQWRFANYRLTVEDVVTPAIAPAIARFHMAPGVTIALNEDRKSGFIVLPSGRRVFWIVNAPADIEASFYYPEFGKHLETQSLVIAIANGQLLTQFDWSP